MARILAGTQKVANVASGVSVGVVGGTVTTLCYQSQDFLSASLWIHHHYNPVPAPALWLVSVAADDD